MFGRVCTAAKWHAACLIFPVGRPGVFALAWNGKLVRESPIEVRHECVGRHWGDATRLAIVLTLFLAPYLTSAQASVRDEYRTKASYLATFPSFIEWPENAFSSPDAPFLVCVLGDFRFGTALAEFARSSSPHGRRIDIRWAHKNDNLRRCHILFISNSEAKSYARILKTVQRADTLTVGETTDFLSAGGMLSFLFQNESLQFEVNLVAANEAHLQVSSKLLALAHRVVRSGFIERRHNC
jgi:YfiR/HmsC-like